MKKTIYTFCLLFISLSADAQLTMNGDMKVSIGNVTEEFEPLLIAGYDSSLEETDDTNIGTGGTPEVGNGNNIGVYGGFWVNSNCSQDSNFGVRGVVNVNNNHGRNYGLCGMINAINSHSGGAGIYGVNCDYCYIFPHNMAGAYSACFVGGVHVSNNLTAPCLFTVMDNRLSDNIVSLNQGKRNGTTTLENLLKMDVVEYNLKERQFEEIPENVDPEKAKKLRRELEFLRKEEQKMASRRHFGVDANELQKVYPDLVLEGQDGHLFVNYLEMVPLIIRSIQELKQELDEFTEVKE